MKTVRTSIRVASVLCVILSAPASQAASGGGQSRSFEGSWFGTLRASPTVSLRVAFGIDAGPDGSLTGTFGSLDQGPTPTPFSRVSQADDRITIEVAAIRARYEGTMNADGAEIVGRWTQGGGSWDLTVKRGRPQEPKRPYPYLDEEVTYANAADGVTLAGTLTLPPTGKPFPAVILISGSGPEDRDETVYWHRPFLILADWLTRRGIAVLRVDDRGVGGSTGSTSQATSTDFARDVLAGAQYLRTRNEIDPNRIGLIGHSEGGIVAPMAAVDSNDVAFIVLMAGPGVTGEQILMEQLVDLLKAAGASQRVIDVAVQEQRRVLDVVKNEADPNVADARLRAIIAEYSPSLSKQQVDAQVQQVTSPWYRFFVTYDPRETLRKVRCPVLAVNGSLDLQVSARTNLPAIEQALRDGGNPDFAVQELPGLNHLFQTARTGGADEYARIEETMAPSALETIAAWVCAHAQ
ncbi:MAG: alpha/beta fold hydrolase [Phycisphaerales bacterium]